MNKEIIEPNRNTELTKRQEGLLMLAFCIFITGLFSFYSFGYIATIKTHSEVFFGVIIGTISVFLIINTLRLYLCVKKNEVIE